MKISKLIIKLLVIISMLLVVTYINHFNLTNFVNKSNVIIIYGLLIASLVLIFLTKKDSKSRNNSIDFITFVFNTIAILLTIVTFIIMPAQIDGDSMEPTYSNNDRVFIKVIKPNIEKDNIIVYQVNGDYIIKRVVGLKGDKVSIEVEDDIYYLLINDNRVQDGFNEDYTIRESDTLFSQVKDSYIVKEDELIILGDNGNNSSDSRSYGISSYKNIVGKVMGGIFG